jgi:multidrug efflux pump subunit AcrA (membrane-fusion protein)
VDPATGQVRLYVRVPNPGMRLAVGLFAEGRVAVRSERGLAIPSDAIDKSAPVPSVKRVRGGVVESVPVTTGLEDELGGRIQVLSGLGAGDTVLVGASLGTPVGAAIRVAARDR